MPVLVFIVAPLTIAKLCSQPKCPSADEWIKNLWYAHTTEYYSALKKKEILSFMTTWMNLMTLCSDPAHSCSNRSGCPS
jgi:hypothetical protein